MKFKSLTSQLHLYHLLMVINLHLTLMVFLHRLEKLSNTGASQYQGLTGASKKLADAVAGPESGSWGYEAFNQGGANNGRSVVGKSGSHKEVFGSSLTDMTLSEIFHRQNTQQRGAVWMNTLHPADCTL